MTDVIDRLDEVRAELDVLAHPFYQRWNAGELSAPELTRYAGQYRHAVKALARASELAAQRAPARHADGLRRHAAEESAHVAMWDAFAAAAGSTGAAACGETEQCARAWTGGEDVLDHLAILYVLEAGQPQISETKIAGLVGHYGYSEEGPATEYFRVHRELDVEHARAARELIEELLDGEADAQARSERMVRHARAALEGNWKLLDGVAAR